MEFSQNISSVSLAEILKVIEVYIGFLTLIALVIGPVLAAKLTRRSDVRQEKERRKWEIFRSLMQNRGNDISAEFVDSLNLIEIEFCDHKSVIKARRKLFKHLCSAVPVGEPAFTNHVREGEKRKIKLLQSVAKACGVDIGDLNIAYDAYSPQGRINSERQTAEIKDWTHEILSGSRHLPIKITEVPKDIPKDEENDNTDKPDQRARPSSQAQSVFSTPPSPEPSEHRSPKAKKNREDD